MMAGGRPLRPTSSPKREAHSLGADTSLARWLCAIAWADSPSSRDGPHMLPLTRLPGFPPRVFSPHRRRTPLLDASAAGVGRRQL